MSYGPISAIQRAVRAIVGQPGFLTFDRHPEGGVTPAFPPRFVHIDWCDSAGDYLAPDCSCPCDCGFEQGVQVFCPAHEPRGLTTFVDSEGNEWTGTPA